MARLVVIGGSAAGMAAAAKAKRVNENLEVVVFERSRYVSYAPCGVPYYIEGLVRDLSSLVYYPVEYFRRKRNIDVRVRHEVLDVDPKAKEVVVKNLDRDENFEMEYDYLVLATGGKPSIPETLNHNVKEVFTLRTLEDGEKIKRACEKAEKIGIVGGGYIGLELTEALMKKGKKVLLFQRSYPMRRALDPEVSNDIIKELQRHNVNLHLGESFRDVESKNKALCVITDKNEYLVDILILAMGVKPNVDLAGRMGVKLGVTGAIKVNDRMETSVKDVYAAGDNVETTHLVSGKPVYFPFAPAANKMGRVAGDNIAGGNSRFRGILGTTFTKIFNLHVGRTGLSAWEAEAAGFDAAAVDITHISRSHYFPRKERMHIRLIADRESQRILGGAITGREGVAGRVNTLAAALWGGLTVEDLTQLDLGYAPPFAPVWDGLIIAANVMKRKL
ncbi:hypothetical protein CW706_01440 [Candidatus Bathyarchaeota archaeon]|nr:MAG: hypothetical protein CW706_01440 [Candidatus Bathyarchaeota archaeon]